MKVARFFIVLLVIFVVALVVYIFTTPSDREIQFTGMIMGNDYIASPLVQGRLEHLYVEEGSAVKKGEVVAEIDPRDLTAARNSAVANERTFRERLLQSNRTLDMNEQSTAAAVQQSEAALSAARAQLQQAETTLALNKVTYDRDQGLYRDGALTAQERDTAEQNYRGSQANVKALQDQVRVAEAQLATAKANRSQVEVQQADVAATRAQIAQAAAQRDQAQVQLGYTQVYAPIDGVVSVRVALPGETVQAGGPIVTILDTDHLWVQADIEETYIDRLTLGQKLKVKLPSGDIVEGTLYFKGVEQDFATQRDVSRTKRDIKTFEIKVAIPNAEHRLFTGMTAYVLLPAKPGERRRWQL
jgi:HlyD family secretion protein